MNFVFLVRLKLFYTAHCWFFKVVPSNAARLYHRANRNLLWFSLLMFNNCYWTYNNCSLNIVVSKILLEIAFTTRIKMFLSVIIVCLCARLRDTVQIVRTDIAYFPLLSEGPKLKDRKYYRKKNDLYFKL